MKIIKNNFYLAQKFKITILNFFWKLNFRTQFASFLQCVKDTFDKLRSNQQLTAFVLALWKPCFLVHFSHVLVVLKPEPSLLKTIQDGLYHLESCLFHVIRLDSRVFFHKDRKTFTVFENQRKSLIQHCERSELRLHFELTKDH